MQHVYSEDVANTAFRRVNGSELVANMADRLAERFQRTKDALAVKIHSSVL